MNLAQRTSSEPLPIVDAGWLRMDRPGNTMTIAALLDLDERLDTAAHVLSRELPRPGGHAAIRAVVDDLLSTPLDRSRPLWQAHVTSTPHPCTSPASRCAAWSCRRRARVAWR